MSEIIFLTLAEVIQIHSDQIEHYGGLDGIRDIKLLESAIAIPEASFTGEFMHNDLFEMAAAYAYHICQNHPFVDGNKRAGLASALVFLDINGIRLLDPDQRLYDAMMNAASGKLDKAALRDIFLDLHKKG